MKNVYIHSEEEAMEAMRKIVDPPDYSKLYLLSDADIEAINRLIQLGGKAACIHRDSVNFEVGILSDDGFLPAAYGSGDTIEDAVNEAIGKPKGDK